MPVIDYIIDEEGLSLASFVNVSSLLCFPLKPYQSNGSIIPGGVIDQYKEVRKKALKNVLVHFLKGYMSANDSEINGEEKGRPS